MRITLRVLLLAVGLAVAFGTSAGHAGTLVEFPNLSEQAPAKLLGYLACRFVGNARQPFEPRRASSGGCRIARLRRHLQPLGENRRPDRLVGVCDSRGR